MLKGGGRNVQETNERYVHDILNKELGLESARIKIRDGVSVPRTETGEKRQPDVLKKFDVEATVCSELSSVSAGPAMEGSTCPD